MKPLHFIITGLISGLLCWLLLILFPFELYFSKFGMFILDMFELDIFEFGIYEILVTYLPGIVVAIALLILGKKQGLISASDTTTSASILIATSGLAQFFIFEYQLSETSWWEIGFYPSLIAGNEIPISSESLFSQLPTPIILAIHSSIIAFGVAFAWDFSAPLPRVLVKSAIYGTLLGLLILFFTHLVSTTVIDSINDTLNIADQTLYGEKVDLLYSLFTLILLSLWHSTLLLSIYMGIRTPSSSAVITDQTQSDPEIYNSLREVDSSTNNIKQNKFTSKQLKTYEIIELLKTRTRSTRQFFYIILSIGLVTVIGSNYHYKTLTNNAYQSMLDSHSPIVQKHAATHPLYKLWPALKSCGGKLRAMKDILWSNEMSSDITECELQVLNRLKHDREDWLFALRSETTELPYYVTSELLLQYNSPNHPDYAFWSSVRECSNMDDVSALIEAKEKDEVLTEDQLYLMDCINETRARIQKSIDGYTTTLVDSDEATLESQGIRMGYYSNSDYMSFSPPWKTSNETWAYWDNYRATMPDDYGNGYPPRSSFQEALNRSWQFGEVVHPAEEPDDPSIYFHNGKLELLTPITIDGETQAILLSTLETTEMDEYIADEWQNFRNLTVPVVTALIILFLWYEHRTLASIPKAMDFKQWKAGLWHPSLLKLYQIDGYRYFHLINMMIFFIFSAILLFLPAEEFWHEQMSWLTWLIHITIIMSLPLLFSLFIIPRMLTDKRLFAKGVPVSCKKVGAKTEKLTTGHMRNSGLHINTEYHDRFYYQSEYQGELYEFSAPAGNADDNSAVAIIEPGRFKHGLILNNFYESD